MKYLIFKQRIRIVLACFGQLQFVLSGFTQHLASHFARSFSNHGWLDTGDIGYRVGDHLFITARSKDVIIIKGRNIWPNDMEVVAQHMEDVRLGGVAAFSIVGHGDDERAIMVVETKLRNRQLRDCLAGRISALMRKHFGINVILDMVKPGPLPRTTSGKLSRFQAREAYLQRHPKNALNLRSGTSMVRDLNAA